MGPDRPPARNGRVPRGWAHPRRLLVAAAAVVAAAVGNTLCPGGGWGFLTGAVVLVAPGPAVVAAVFPAGRGSVTRTERWTWSAAVSMACAAVGGMLLNLGSLVNRTGWVLVLTTITVLALIVVELRTPDPDPVRAQPGEPPVVIRAELPAGVATGPARRRPVVLRPPVVRPMLLAVSVAVAAAAVGLSVASARDVPRSGFTQLWLLQAADSPDTPDGVEVGVTSYELTPGEFTVELYQGRLRSQVWQLRLAPGQSWRAGVSTTGRTRIAARLLPAGTGRAARWVVLRTPSRSTGMRS